MLTEQPKIKNITFFESLIKASYPSSIGIGFGLIFYYCWSIGYIPTGISIGDSLVALFVVFIAYFLYFFVAILVFYTSTPTIWLSKIICNITNKLIRIANFEQRKTLRERSLKTVARSPARLLCTAIYLAAIAILLMYKKSIINASHAFWFDVLFMSLFIPCIRICRKGIVNSRIVTQLRTEHLHFAIMFSMLFTMIFLSSSYYLTEYVMEIAGIRKINTSIMVSDEKYKFIKTSIYGEEHTGSTYIVRGPSDCGHKIEGTIFPTKNSPINANILFSGIGSSYLLQIGDCRFIIPIDETIISYRDPTNTPTNYTIRTDQPN